MPSHMVSDLTVKYFLCNWRGGSAVLRLKERLVSESTHMRVVGTRAGKPQVILPNSSLALFFPQNAKMLGGKPGRQARAEGTGGTQRESGDRWAGHRGRREESEGKPGDQSFPKVLSRELRSLCL